jgi:hypothetical protein
MCEAHVGKLFLPLKEMVCFNKFLGSGDCVNSLLDGVMASWQFWPWTCCISILQLVHSLFVCSGLLADKTH